jgi:hypothetical protein
MFWRGMEKAYPGRGIEATEQQSGGHRARRPVPGARPSAVTEGFESGDICHGG